MLGTIRIEQDEPGVDIMKQRIYLDDKDISRFVRGYTIHGYVGTPTVVHLECVGFLELPEEIQAVISAQEEKKLVDVTAVGDEARHRTEIK